MKGLSITPYYAVIIPLSRWAPLSNLHLFPSPISTRIILSIFPMIPVVVCNQKHRCAAGLSNIRAIYARLCEMQMSTWMFAYVTGRSEVQASCRIRTVPFSRDVTHPEKRVYQNGDMNKVYNMVKYSARHPVIWSEIGANSICATNYLCYL